ncbi:putative lipid II flippase FtsW [Candidatus Dojkabacteria bacterium]|nr:putative lipid II flippase FtsW [Candidatus Dojkabacteria bacterium]
MIAKMVRGKKTILKRRKNLRRITKSTPDKTLLFLILGLSIFGLLMVYSSSFITVKDNPFYFFFRQSIYIIIGLICCFFVYIIDYKQYPKYIAIGLGISILLLILVLIPGIGKTINGATRWIDLKLFDLQPSELTKLTFLIYLAAWTSKQKSQTKNVDIEKYLKKDLIPFITILTLISLLILLEPDLATTGIIGLTSLAVYFLSGRDYLHNIGTAFILVILILFGIFAAILAPYRYKRVNTYKDFLITGEVQDPKGTGYQLQNILIAVGSGGLFGVGFGESRQKFHYLGQTAFSDNIFAVIAEEFGLVGSLILTSIYFYILFRGLKIAEKVPDRFGRLLSSGIVIWITLQAFLHIGANIGLIPVTGIPLPFISYGGSSTVTIFIALGILLNISRQANLNNR